MIIITTERNDQVNNRFPNIKMCYLINYKQSIVYIDFLNLAMDTIQFSKNETIFFLKICKEK